jgi:hypothetical protein
MVAVGLGLVAAVVSAITHGRSGRTSDFALMLAAAESWLKGLDPYVVLGAGRDQSWSFPLVYPFTAVLFAVPFTLIPFPDALFTGASISLWSWAVLRSPRFYPALWMIPTFACVHVVRMSQWSALLTAAALMPSLGFLLTCKPTIGAALWVAYPSRTSLIGGAAFIMLSLALAPSWPWGWIATLGEVPHVIPPIAYAGGPLLLLALLRWRLPEGRLLAAFACTPQTLAFYELVPLFLIPRTHREGIILAVGSWVGLVAAYSVSFPNLDPMARYMAERASMGNWIVWTTYLPCLVMVLLRPNRWPDSETV